MKIACIECSCKITVASVPMKHQHRNILLFFYFLLVLGSIFAVTKLKFSFDFQQFFPQGDPDWEFYKRYIEDFESDDNFLLLAVENKKGVFDSLFLSKVQDLTLRAGQLSNIVSANSITNLQLPLKTPFGYTSIPALHIDQPDFYAGDSMRIMQDRRLVNNLIASDGRSLCIAMKTRNQYTHQEAEQMVDSLELLYRSYGFDDTHMLGRAYFQRALIAMEKREIAVSTGIAAILAILVLFFIFRTWRMVFVAVTGIGLALLFFMGALSVLGRELNALSALYPVLMCIVGVADTIHITSKYLDELGKGHTPDVAIRITLREIGLATFITCITTAIGFASLITNRTAPIQGFGLNAALGVILAFFAIYGWLWAILPRYTANQLIKITPEYAFWDKFMNWTYGFTKRRARSITWVSFGLLAVCLVGISQIHTNYKIKNNLPRGHKITADFLYFERVFSGFRPVEVAVFPQNGKSADDFAVLKEIDKLEAEMRKVDAIKTIHSINDIYRSLYALNHGNQADKYKLPDSLAEFENYRRITERIPSSAVNVLLSKNKDKARIAARMRDVGRDSVALVQASLENWWQKNTDSATVKFKMTGTGLILDKNSAYIRDNMLQGLIPSVLIVALLMGFLFRNWKMVLVFTVPNVFPLLFAGALIGFAGIPLEAGIATVFSIVFGIATDDTIHFLSTFKICRSKGMDLEQSLKTTLQETGKAMCLGSIILFFSFLVMLFSVHPPSVMVGVLVSITLAGALFCDLLLVPILVRRLLKDS